MARKKAQPKNSRRFRIVTLAIGAILLALLGAVGYGALNASLVRLRRAEVGIADLPAAFEGATILYISDIDLCGINTAEKSAELVNRLQALKPDALLLGGDYTSPSLLELLNRTEDARSGDDRTRARSDFFHYISAFDAPLGRYALAAPEDGDPAALQAVLNECGFQSISDAAVPLRRGADVLWLAGFSSEHNISGLLSRDAGISAGDCVIAAAYSPACFPTLMTLEAPGGGGLIDLALAGHTHGGQVRLFGRNVLILNGQERQYLYGWSRDANVPMLTTSGLGCEGLNVRIGTAPEAWLITLTQVREEE